MASIPVDIDGQGSRLDRFLRRKNYHFPQALFEKWSRQKKLLINDTVAKAASRLSEGDIVTFPDDAISKPQVEDVTPLLLTEKEAMQQVRSMLVFEDAGLVVINKPHGLATQGGAGQRISVDDVFRAAYPLQKCRLTHRIDRETSGLLLIAKTLAFATEITNAFRDRTVEKTYVAVCHGIFSKKMGTINHPIGKSKENLELMSTKGFEPKEAITHFRIIGENVQKKISLVELSPKTGRTHQLRVHMSNLGHPILGDKKYDGPQAARLMLHAWKIMWKNRAFEAPLPSDFSV